jgi:hypothetical protein
MNNKLINKLLRQKGFDPIASLVVLMCCFSCAWGQETFLVSIPWENPKEIVFNEQKMVIPAIAGQDYNFDKPHFYWQEKIKGPSGGKISMISYQTSTALPVEIAYLKNQSILVPTEIESKSRISRGGSEYFSVITLFPFLDVGGVIHRVTSLEMQRHSVTKEKEQKSEKSFVGSSVLSQGSGFWYKIAVTSDGIHKIDKAFLEACGINTVGLNPNSINIFGNGDGKLPELNSVPRTDDLAKNSIFLAGGEDGVFDDNDYILFYGWGPSRWYQKDAENFYQDKNIYSDVSYYFINVNPNDSPARISSLSSSNQPVTHPVNSYSYYATHEVDLVSLFSGGQRWYGELFDAELSKVFNFSVPNIDPGTPAKFRVSMASNSSSTSGNTQTYRVNGVQIGSSNLPSGNFGRTDLYMQFPNPTSSLPLTISVTRNPASITTYLDKITLNARRNLVFSGNPFNFRDLNSVGAGNIAGFLISNVPSSFMVWDITDRHTPKTVNGSLIGSDYSFQLSTDSLREFVASTGTIFYTPERVGSVAHQNLHALSQADYLIVTAPNFVDQANRLASLHTAQGLSVHVATTDQIFNEFSSGMLDPTAIRSFGKMFYDRGIANSSILPKYLLLFGDGTFDPKNRVPNNNNFVPTYQVLYSENYIAAMVTDDYYGLYDDDEAIDDTDLLDIGVGRLLISDNTTAKQQVDKIEHYMKNGSNLYSSAGNACVSGVEQGGSTFGDWRLKTVMIADDEENGYFINTDAEPISKYVKANYPEINWDKLYLDAYVQSSGAGGQRYPEVKQAITDRVERGALIVNYVGHGGEVGVAEERVITIPQIQDWRNIDKMNLMVSATCEFTKFDDPSRISAGEWASLNPYGASIALMTTTRSVYFNVNSDTGEKFFKNVYTRDADNKPLAFGEIIRRTKNQVGASDNKRSFTLIGDPALRIALPEMRIVTDSINFADPLLEIDTIRALSKMTVKGHLEDYSSNVITDFNGVVYPTVLDKPKQMSTLGQDATSPLIPFELQKNSLYKGKSTVRDGYFEFSFIVPKDINYSYGKGKISYYAENGVYDAAGLDTMLIIGGIDSVGIIDDAGPSVTTYLNNKSFVDYGITDETPVLIAEMFDENGINTVGNGVGHDILAVLDDNTANPIILNEYYTSDLDSYQSGSLQYRLPELEKGEHKLSLKVWDVNNNSTESVVNFVVQEKEEMKLDHVLNYPNPFTTNTEFFFEHNQVCLELETQIQIFTVSGKLVKTINQSVMTNGYRSFGIPWDGLDEYGDQLAKGVYVYRLTAKTLDGKKAEKVEKLVILK